jgi:hypothetical protein
MTAALTSTVVTRQVLMSGPMVRAILDGTKTQTRRVILPQPNNPHTFGISPIWGYGCKDGAFYIHAAFCEDGQRVDRQLRCPYGQPGDRLWVRETFGYVTCIASRSVPTALRQEVVYRAGERTGIPVPGTSPVEFVIEWHRRLRTRRPVAPVDPHAALGLPPHAGAHRRARRAGAGHQRGGRDRRGRLVPAGLGDMRSGAEHYHDLWDSLNAARGYGWDANPWVWVLEFRRI